jgi:hypothetical protein
MKEHKEKTQMLNIWAEFASRIFLRLSIDNLQNGRVKELDNVASFIFICWCVLVDWLDNHIHEKPIAINVCWISQRCMCILVCNNIQK